MCEKEPSAETENFGNLILLLSLSPHKRLLRASDSKKVSQASCLRLCQKNHLWGLNANGKIILDLFNLNKLFGHARMNFSSQYR
jgi:hypothetical protein